MFHEGDLNSGISRAIAEGKLVACFVREDGNEESRVWEEDWFGQKPRMVSQGDWRPGTGEIFAMKAVILRIDMGSTEATFLNAFCPITTAPTFLVIHNGQVLEKLEAGISRQEFLERACKSLGLEASIMTRQEYHDMRARQGNRNSEEMADAADLAQQLARRTQQQANAIDSGSGSREEVSRATTPGIATPDSTDTAPATTANPTNEVLSPSAQLEQEARDADMSALFPDRAQRMEAEKVKREAEEKAKRKARQDARRKEAEEAHAAHKGKQDDSIQKEKARRDWLVQQKQRKEEAKQERERILRQIEADKQERKARAAERPRTESDQAPMEPLRPSMSAASRRRTGAGGICDLSIRLFDGSSIKGRFEPSATLAKNVREWIREETTDQNNPHAADVPFTFKQILAPLPSRSIEISEENQSVAEMGLSPNATLVLVPISGYTEAYSGGSGRGYMSTALYAAYGVVGTASGLVSSALSYVPGFSGAPPASANSTPLSEQSTSESNVHNGSIKVKTLADQRAEAASKQNQQNEFYNGNSSAFQGRKDDDNDKEN